MLNRRGGELIDLKERPPPPVTVPEVTFLTTGPPVDDEPERREVAAKFLEARTVKAGVECWQAIGRAESFEAWVKIGKALQIGRDHSLKATGANRPMGQSIARRPPHGLPSTALTGCRNQLAASPSSLPRISRPSRRGGTRYRAPAQAAYFPVSSDAKMEGRHRAKSDTPLAGLEA